MQTINDRFLIARKSKKLSQEAIGKLLHISGAAYSRIENGVNNPSAQTTSLMCSALGINEEWLKTGEGDMFASSDDSTVAALCEKHHFSSIERKMLETYIALDAKYREGVLKYVENLVLSYSGADYAKSIEEETEKANAAIRNHPAFADDPSAEPDTETKASV